MSGKRHVLTFVKQDCFGKDIAIQIFFTSTKAELTWQFDPDAPMCLINYFRDHFSSEITDACMKHLSGPAGGAANV